MTVHHALSAAQIETLDAAVSRDTFTRTYRNIGVTEHVLRRALKGEPVPLDRYESIRAYVSRWAMNRAACEQCGFGDGHKLSCGENPRRTL